MVVGADPPGFPADGGSSVGRWQWSRTLYLHPFLRLSCEGGFPEPTSERVCPPMSGFGPWSRAGLGIGFWSPAGVPPFSKKTCQGSASSSHRPSADPPRHHPQRPRHRCVWSLLRHVFQQFLRFKGFPHPGCPRPRGKASDSFYGGFLHRGRAHGLGADLCRSGGGCAGFPWH